MDGGPHQTARRGGDGAAAAQQARDEAWPVPTEALTPGPPIENGETRAAPPRARSFAPLRNPWVAGGLLLVVAFGLGAGALLAPSVRGSSGTLDLPPPMNGATADVPRVTGLELGAARGALREAGLRVTVHTTQSARAPGVVLSQSPEAGRTLATGTAVRLVVAAPVAKQPASSGSTATKVDTPSVVGLRSEDAVQRLRATGLRARIRLVPSSESAGSVIRQHPDASAEAARGVVVTLEVAKPQATAPSRPAKAVMPLLVGSSVGDATTQLRQLKLRWSVTEVASGRPEATVLAQQPTTGAQVREGDLIELRVSSGPAAVVVPEVADLDEQAATQQLEAKGFDVGVADEATDDPMLDGVVVQQEPVGGTELAKGSVVTITVGRLA